MNAIEEDVAERVRASIIQQMTHIWQGHWRTANGHRANGQKEAERRAVQYAIAVNLARESVRMMDLEELLAPVEEEQDA